MDTNYVRENADGTMYYPPTLPKPRDNLLLIYEFVPMALYFAGKVIESHVMITITHPSRLLILFSGLLQCWTNLVVYT